MAQPIDVQRSGMVPIQRLFSMQTPTDNVHTMKMNHVATSIDISAYVQNFKFEFRDGHETKLGIAGIIPRPKILGEEGSPSGFLYWLGGLRSDTGFTRVLFLGIVCQFKIEDIVKGRYRGCCMEI